MICAWRCTQMDRRQRIKGENNPINYEKYSMLGSSFVRGFGSHPEFLCGRAAARPPPVAEVGVGVHGVGVGVYDTLPGGYDDPYYFYGGRYYYGGVWEPGRFRWHGRWVDGRYRHGGHVFYGHPWDAGHHHGHPGIRMTDDKN